jgi:hypothetical protein
MQRVFAIEIYHRNPGADGVWFRVVNAEDEKAAIRKAIALFVGDSLSALLIDKISPTELVVLKGGEGG